MQFRTCLEVFHSNFSGSAPRTLSDNLVLKTLDLETHIKNGVGGAAGGGGLGQAASVRRADGGVFRPDAGGAPPVLWWPDPPPPWPDLSPPRVDLRPWVAAARGQCLVGGGSRLQRVAAGARG